MGKGVTRSWTAAGAVLTTLVVVGALVVFAGYVAGNVAQDRDLVFHGGASLVLLVGYLPWFVLHYCVRPSLTSLLLPLVAVCGGPVSLAFLALVAVRETPDTDRLRVLVVATVALAPMAGAASFVARCRRRWARMVALAATVQGGRVVEVVESVHQGRWTAVRLVDVRTGEREQAPVWGHFSRGDVCVVDGALTVLDRSAAIVRGFGAPRVRGRPTTHYVTAPS